MINFGLAALLSVSCVNETNKIAVVKENYKIQGFGILEEVNYHLAGPRVFRTDKNYLLEFFDNKVYLVEPETMRLLSVDADKIKIEDENVVITKNGKETIAKPPKSLLEIEDDYHRRNLFDEREDGIYLR